MPNLSASLCQLRFLVAFLGQASLGNWWKTDVLNDTGQQFLVFNFSRNPLLAGFTATCLAARRVHDDRIGRRGAFHLFRFPGEMEQELHRVASTQNSSFLAALPRTQEQASAMLTQLAAEKVDAPEGPVQIGNLRDTLPPNI
jgi:hypothetical protein